MWTYHIAHVTLLNAIFSLDGRRLGGRINTCICMAASLHCSPETIIALLIGYIPIKNKKF